VGVEQRKLLMAVRHVAGVVDVECDARRRHCVGGHPLVDERRPHEVRTVKVRPPEVRPPEVRPAEVCVNERFLEPPGIPDVDALPEDFERSGLATERARKPWANVLPTTACLKQDGECLF
jgi:hypothetical protein